MSQLIGATIGEYRIVDFIGEGGMGAVYRAEHSKLGRIAAVKFLSQSAASGHGFVERFFNEARIQASLQHPNIAALYDFLEFNGQPCIIMEYIDGQTLCDRVRPVGPLPLAEALNIFCPVVEAIGYIHSHGVIHRDIKSNNIKISSSGQVKLLDFGIAKGQTSPGLTSTGSVIGTLEYISPEQLKGGHADARSDIWALGVLLYEMLTGRVPFVSQTLGDLCEKIDRAQYPPPTAVNPQISREAEQVIARCLARDPAQRYQSTQELLEDARRLYTIALAPPPQQQQAARTAPQTPPFLNRTAPDEIKSEPPKSKTWMWLAGGAAAIVAVVLLLAVSGGALLMMSGDTSNEANANVVNNSNPTNNAQKSGAPMKRVMIDAAEGHAEVWRDGVKVGVTPIRSMRG